MACTQCHMAKVKCDKVLPCSRCVRLSLICVRHISRQGQGKKKRLKRGANLVTAADSSNGGMLSGAKKTPDGLCQSEDGCLVEQLSKDKQQTHFGLHYLIRSWISISMKRRSFSLLSRAAKLGSSVGITMDDILVEKNDQRGMDFLYPILLVPFAQQKTTDDRPLTWSDVPQRMLVAMGCQEQEAEKGNPDTTTNGNRENRWIWIREMKQGMSNYLVSNAFGRDIASWTLVQETWKANRQAVVELFMDSENMKKHTRGFAHQISLHVEPGKLPQCSRLSRVKIRTAKSNQHEVEVDLVCCLDIVNIDHAFLFFEYVRREPEPVASSSTGDDAITEFDMPFFDLDEFVDDKELEMFFNLMQ